METSPDLQKTIERLESVDGKTVMSIEIQHSFDHLQSIYITIGETTFDIHAGTDRFYDPVLYVDVVTE